MDIYVRTEKLSRIGSRISKAEKTLQQADQAIGTVSKELADADNSFQSVRKNLSQIQKKIDASYKATESFSSTATIIANLYKKTEERIVAGGEHISHKKGKDSLKNIIKDNDYVKHLLKELGLKDDSFDGVPDLLETLGLLNRAAPWTWIYYRATKEGWLDDLFAAVDFETDSDGIYHVNTDKYDINLINQLLNDKNGVCWQQIGKYTDAYDYVFDCFCDMEANRNLEFRTKSGETYVLWRWKGEYLNLGAGGELGLYKGSGPIKDCAVNDELKISMHVDYGDGTSSDWSDETWWCTSFNPDKQYVKAEDISITYTVDFSDADPELWNAFREQLGTDPDVTLSDTEKIAYIKF